MTRSSLCEYSDAFVLVERTIIITGERADVGAGQGFERGK